MKKLHFIFYLHIELFCISNSKCGQSLFPSEVKQAKKRELSYPHRKLNSPSQYTPKASRKRDKLAVSVFIITYMSKTLQLSYSQHFRINKLQYGAVDIHIGRFQI